MRKSVEVDLRASASRTTRVADEMPRFEPYKRPILRDAAPSARLLKDRGYREDRNTYLPGPTVCIRSANIGIKMKATIEPMMNGIVAIM